MYYLINLNYRTTLDRSQKAKKQCNYHRCNTYILTLRIMMPSGSFCEDQSRFMIRVIVVNV